MTIKKNLNFIKKVFIDHFKCLHKRFKDTRELFFPEKDEKGRIPHILFKEDAIIQANWTERIIEIRFNEDLIRRERIENPDWNIKSLKRYFKEIAKHEYGHTMTLKNIFLLFPKDTRHTLMEKNFDGITRDDLTRCYSESSCYPREFFTLQNIDLNFLEHIFLDFWANLKVRDEIDKKSPEICLNERFSGFYGLTPQVINRKTFLELLLFTQLHYIYDKWDELVEIFRKCELDQLLWLYKSINEFFNKIVELDDDFDSMEDDLVELARKMEIFNYHEIIFNNRLTNQDKSKMQTFMRRLREKDR